MRTDYIDKDIIGHILFALTEPNRLACKVALETGLRIGDVLSIRTEQLKNNSFTITEQKTGKKKRVRLRQSLRAELLRNAGTFWAFEHRTDSKKHRTRQAVYADIKRACKAFRITENISPHSLRKIYAVDLFKRSGDLKKVCEALQHDNVAVSMIYAMADILSKKRGEG